MDLSTASENVARAEATIQRLEDELAHASRSGANGNGLADEELQGELRSLVNELASLSERHQVLQDECENERQARLDAEDRAADWRRQYEQTVAELRNYKGTHSERPRGRAVKLTTVCNSLAAFRSRCAARWPRRDANVPHGRRRRCQRCSVSDLA